MKVHDESRIPEFLRMLSDLQSTHLEMGIFGEDDSEILMIATVNEFGCNIKVTDRMRGYLHTIGIHLKADTKEINIPERSFMRSSYTKNKSEMIEKGDYLLERVINLQLPVKVFFETLGEYIVGLIQTYLTELKNPPNHPATIANKSSSNPLIDDRQLRSSITYRLVKN